MRRILAGWLVVGLLVAGCQGSGQVIPTVAQLPTVTPTEEVFFTPTPEATTPPPTPTEAPDADQATATTPPTQEQAPPPGFTSPTPETAESLGEAAGGPCSPAEMESVLAEADLEALRQGLDGLMTRLRQEGASLAGWALDASGDPMAGEVIGDFLPFASLRYRREGNQEMVLLLSQMSEGLRGYLSACISAEEYFLQGDVLAGATVTVEPLSLGDQATLARIVQPVALESGDTGVTELETRMITMLVGDTLVQYVDIPALAEVSGLATVPQEDAIALLSALADVIRGL